MNKKILITLLIVFGFNFFTAKQILASGNEANGDSALVEDKEGLNDQLINAIKNSDIKQVDELIKKGADVNAINKNNLSRPLHELALKPNKEIAKLLINAGADVKVKDDAGLTPLHLANDKETIDLILTSGADVNIKDVMDWTPLHWAAAHGNKDKIESLLQANANKDIEDKNGRTPARLAENEEIAELINSYSPVTKR